jgi:hypothetical protein
MLVRGILIENRGGSYIYHRGDQCTQQKTSIRLMCGLHKPNEMADAALYYFVWALLQHEQEAAGNVMGALENWRARWQRVNDGSQGETGCSC